MVEEAKRCGGVKNWEGKKKIKKNKKERQKERKNIELETTTLE